MTTDERFDALEKTVGRQRITITALVLVAVAAAVITAAPQSRDATFDVVTTKRLWIVNDAGEAQAGLATDEDGGNLVIWNAAGEIQARLLTDEDGGVLNIFNPAGKLIEQIP